MILENLSSLKFLERWAIKNITYSKVSIFHLYLLSTALAYSLTGCFTSQCTNAFKQKLTVLFILVLLLEFLLNEREFTKASVKTSGSVNTSADLGPKKFSVLCCSVFSAICIGCCFCSNFLTT